MDRGALLPTARDRLSSTMPARVPIGVIPSTSSHHVRCRTITQRQDERSRAVRAILPHLATTLACMPSPSPAPCISKFVQHRSQIGTLYVTAVKLSQLASFCNLFVDFCKHAFHHYRATSSYPLLVPRRARARCLETITGRHAATAIGDLQKHKTGTTPGIPLRCRSWVHLFTGGPRGSCGSVVLPGSCSGDRSRAHLFKGGPGGSCGSVTHGFTGDARSDQSRDCAFFIFSN
jgi:hypothetical protein